MEQPTSWSLVVGYCVLAAVTATTISLFSFLTTSSFAYSHFHPRYLTDDDFPASAKEQSQRSGYARFARTKDDDGRLKIEASVAVVVLGDIGRSPRMQYHALSIAAHGGLVDLIGYAGSDVHPDVAASAFINIVPVAPWPEALQTENRLLFLALAPFKVLWQTASLFVALAFATRASKWMLVQNPPSIPTLLVARAACYLRNTRLVVDWHNFGYSILALRLGPAHPLVRLAEWYEGFFARGASAHVCVTDAMARVLREKWRIAALPLHDRPPAIFQPLPREQRAGMLARLPGTAPFADALKEGSCRLLVSSTSWTVDEDFSVLLDALVEYSSAAAAATAEAVAAAGAAASSKDGAVEVRGNLPNILAIITGRGPLRADYLERMAALADAGKLEHIVAVTAWLAPADYAALLAVADLGVSLHTSSSGVDLPMKVVDMFGTGLPVAGFSNFEAWPELVHEGVNGRGFKSAEQLYDILKELFVDGSNGRAGSLDTLRAGAMKECSRRWDDEWMPVAGRLFQLEA